MRVGVITGLKSEADCLLPHADRNLWTIAAGPGPEAADALARGMADSGCGLLISFGIAGALAPDLRPGDVVVAGDVITPSGHLISADASLRRKLIDGMRALHPAQPVVEARIYGSEAIISTVAEKSLIHRDSGAGAVDIERGRIAEAAAARDLPFVAVRAIADPSEMSIPGMVTDVIDAQGRPRLALLLGRLVIRPHKIRPLLKLAVHSRAAHAALRHVAPVVAKSI